MPRLVFWDVDTQYDFIAPDGKLYVPGAEELEPALAGLTRFAHVRGVPIVASSDDHALADPEISDHPDWSATFPPHCMHGTPGQLKVAATALRDPLVIQPAPEEPVALTARIRAHRGDFLVLKHALDVFSNPNTEVLLDILAPDAIVLYGVATDFCDRLAVEGLLRARPGVTLLFVSNAARAIDPARGDALLRDWTARGVRPVTTDDILHGNTLERSL